MNDEAPAGALCGLGAWALGCGARVAPGIGVCVDGYRLPALAVKADLVVTGTDVLDFHRRGGDVVTKLTQLGVEALRDAIGLVLPTVMLIEHDAGERLPRPFDPEFNAYRCCHWPCQMWDGSCLMVNIVSVYVLDINGIRSPINLQL